MVKVSITNHITGEVKLIDIDEEPTQSDESIEPTLEERLEKTEQLIQATTMAFTEYVFTQGTSDDS